MSSSQVSSDEPAWSERPTVLYVSAMVAEQMVSTLVDELARN